MSASACDMTMVVLFLLMFIAAFTSLLVTVPMYWKMHHSLSSTAEQKLVKIMAASNQGPHPTFAAMARLSSKEGVRCTVLLSAVSGAIITISGSVSTFANVAAPQTDSTASTPEEAGDGMDEVASIVYQFVKSAGALVQSFDAQDETRLLRLRTKQYELVIVPNAQFICFTVHDVIST